MVLFVCFLFSISAAFEYQLVSEKSCQLNRSQVADDAAMTFETGGMEPTSLEDNERTLKRVRRADSGHNFNSNASMSLRRLERSLDNDVPGAGINATDDAVNSSKLSHKTSHNPNTTTDHYVNDAQRDNATSRVISQHNHNTCSSVSDFYRNESHNVILLPNNKTLRSLWRFLSSSAAIVKGSGKLFLLPRNSSLNMLMIHNETSF